MADDLRIKPTMVLPKGQMDRDDIAQLRENNLCVVEAEDPALVRFMEPPPEGYTLRELAAIQLFRIVMTGRSNATWSRADLATKFAEILIEGRFPQRPEAVLEVKK